MNKVGMIYILMYCSPFAVKMYTTQTAHAKSYFNTEVAVSLPINVND